MSGMRKTYFRGMVAQQRKRKKESAKESIDPQDMIKKIREEPADKDTPLANERLPSAQVIRQVELHQTSQELRRHYPVSALNANFIRIETGLPTKEVFDIVVKYALRFNDTSYFLGWKVKSIPFQDQIFITELHKPSPCPAIFL